MDFVLNLRTRGPSCASIQMELPRVQSWYKPSVTRGKMIKISSVIWQSDPSREGGLISAGQSVSCLNRLFCVVVLTWWEPICLWIYYTKHLHLGSQMLCKKKYEILQNLYFVLRYDKPERSWLFGSSRFLEVYSPTGGRGQCSRRHQATHT